MANINLPEMVAVRMGYIGQRFQVACIGQFINVDNGVGCMANNMADYRLADKSRTAGYQYFHDVCLSVRCLALRP